MCMAICTGLSPDISGIGGTTVTGPCQSPARVFSVSNDFCASDGAPGVAEDWARAAGESEIAAAERIKQIIWGFMFISSSNSCLSYLGFRPTDWLGGSVRTQISHCALLYLTTTLTKKQEVSLIFGRTFQAIENKRVIGLLEYL